MEQESYKPCTVSLDFCVQAVRSTWLQCRKVSISTCSGLRLALFFEAMLPAAENKRSDGVDVAGIHSRDFASFASVG